MSSSVKETSLTVLWEMEFVFIFIYFYLNIIKFIKLIYITQNIQNKIKFTYKYANKFIKYYKLKNINKKI